MKTEKTQKQEFISLLKTACGRGKCWLCFDRNDRFRWEITLHGKWDYGANHRLIYETRFCRGDYAQENVNYERAQKLYKRCEKWLAKYYESVPFEQELKKFPYLLKKENKDG